MEPVAIQRQLKINKFRRFIVTPFSGKIIEIKRTFGEWSIKKFDYILYFHKKHSYVQFSISTIFIIHCEHVRSLFDPQYFRHDVSISILFLVRPPIPGLPSSYFRASKFQQWRQRPISEIQMEISGMKRLTQRKGCPPHWDNLTHF